MATPTKDRLLAGRPAPRRKPAPQPAQRTAAPTMGPRNKAASDYDELIALRKDLRARVWSLTPAETALLRTLNELPAAAPVAARNPRVDDRVYAHVWDGFAKRVNALLPAIARLRGQAGR